MVEISAPHNKVSDVLAQSNTHQPGAYGSVTVAVESHAFVPGIGGRCTEVWRLGITTPTVALLVTTASVTGDEEAAVERSIADQKLVRVSTAHGPHTVP